MRQHTIPDFGHVSTFQTPDRFYTARIVLGGHSPIAVSGYATETAAVQALASRLDNLTALVASLASKLERKGA